jgi:uncharacterized protein GlcG (DUF336 family)
MGAKPLGYAVVDAGGHLLALARDERAGFLRATIAANKAWDCMALGISGARAGTGREGMGELVRRDSRSGERAARADSRRGHHPQRGG